jgi:Ca2+-transporting ATPase
VTNDGLDAAEARARLARDGPNELPQAHRRGGLRLLRDVVTEPMFLLLVGCGLVYMLLGDRGEALMLLGFVFVVMGITFVQQRRSERSLEALRDLSSPQANVWREGKPTRIASRELVCDDIVLLAEGDRIPADMVLVESSNLAVDESMLTGEAVAVDKSAAAAVADGAVPVAIDDRFRVFSGTLVTQGTARGRVTATGNAARWDASASRWSRSAGKTRRSSRRPDGSSSAWPSADWRSPPCSRAPGWWPPATG